MRAPPPEDCARPGVRRSPSPLRTHAAGTSPVARALKVPATHATRSGNPATPDSVLGLLVSVALLLYLLYTLLRPEKF
ncbi:MAG: K(+)-transporting ATPase subunit F [Gemmatimonadetes bacterium]|nr:K(+)-transporting ATPase subunit F [Gemmatimonadota bacterium]